MDVKKTELKETKLNALFLTIERHLDESKIEEKVKCHIMLAITAIVTECVLNPPSLEDGKAIHEYCSPYALRYAELDDSPLNKALAELLLK